uniref:Uncharacterized protein n=1 Tax=Panstrongylus lignarius TaxID=156445 RepID=A0A224XR07_9HEMI
MYPEHMIGSSGSIPLITYILVFSMIARRFGLSDAHNIVHTSRLSNLPPLSRLPSHSTIVKMPVLSITEIRVELQLIARLCGLDDNAYLWTSATCGKE